MKHPFIASIVIPSIALIFAVVPCAAQWQSIDIGTQIGGFGAHDTSLFICTSHHVYHYTAAHGYEYADSGILTGDYVSAFATYGPYFFADSYVYRLNSDGLSWTTNQNAGGPICGCGAYLFGAWYHGILRSHDTGESWDSVSNIIPLQYATIGSCILAVTKNGLYRSKDTGNPGTWTADSMPVTSTESFAFLGTILFGSNGPFSNSETPSGPIVKSTDSGSTWTNITIAGRSVTVLASSGTNLFAGTDSGVFLSTDSGGHWRPVNDGLGKFLRINALGVFDTLLFANATDVTFLGKWYTASRSIPEMVADTTPASVVEAVRPSDSIEVYPNPSLGTFSIVSSEPILSLQVVSIMGTDVLSRPSEDASHLTLDLSNKPAGTYFLEIQTAKGIVLKKITLER